MALESASIDWIQHGPLAAFGALWAILVWWGRRILREHDRHSERIRALEEWRISKDAIEKFQQTKAEP